jgi:hypothetical protein
MSSGTFFRKQKVVLVIRKKKRGRGEVEEDQHSRREKRNCGKRKREKNRKLLSILLRNKIPGSVVERVDRLDRSIGTEETREID